MEIEVVSAYFHLRLNAAMIRLLTSCTVDSVLSPLRGEDVMRAS